MAVVNQEFSASGQETIERAYRDLAKDVVRLEQQLQKLSQTSSRGAKEGTEHHSALDRILQRQMATLGGVAASWLSVQKVMELVNAELERTMRLQDAAAGAHEDLARGHAELFLNTFGQDDATKQKYLSAGKRISALTGVSESAVMSSLGRQAGRGINLTADQIIAAQEYATRLGRHTPEQIEPLSTVIQQTMRATGKDAQWSSALAQSGAAAAFPGNPMLQSRFLQQALTGSLANIDKPDARSAEQIVEIAAWLSQAGGEERGEAGRTAAISMLAQFEEFREGRGKWQVTTPGGMKLSPRPIKDAPSAPGDFIAWLQKNPSQMRRFFDKASFEQHYEGIIRRGMMDPSSQVGKLLAETQETVKPDIPALQRQLADLERGTPQISTANEAAKTRNRQIQVAGRKTIEALQKEARGMIVGQEGSPSALDLTKDYGPPAWIENAANWFGQRFTFDPIEQTAWATLQRRSASIRGRVGSDRLGRPMIGGVEGALQTIPTPDSMLSNQQRAALDVVNAQLKRLEEIRDEIKQLRSEGSSRTPAAGPAMNMQRGAQNER
jgi:hypothetical protein